MELVQCLKISRLDARVEGEIGLLQWLDGEVCAEDMSYKVKQDVNFVRRLNGERTTQYLDPATSASFAAKSFFLMSLHRLTHRIHKAGSNSRSRIFHVFYTISVLTILPSAERLAGLFLIEHS